MQWLNKIVEQIIAGSSEDGEILIESGHSPSGTYHLGHMREPLTCDAILLELRRRGRQARHISYVDDLDALRKIPANIPAEYEKYLGKSLCDIPSPGGTGSYGEYFLAGLKEACSVLNIDVEFVYSHDNYRSGFFVEAIEKTLQNIAAVRQALEKISGRQLDDNWSPIQINEDGYLKKRTFVSIDTSAKSLEYIDKSGESRSTSYEHGEVKLDWRLDWPARWWLLNVAVEPFGRDHASSGGSYDTGVQIVKDVFQAEPPYPVPYDFINLVGDTKKMSASKGTGLEAAQAARVMPAEVWRYLIFSVPPAKRLYFDPINGVIQLMDNYAAFRAKPNKTPQEQQLLYLCTHGSSDSLVSNVPFSHLVASYQAALRDPAKTIAIIERTEHGHLAAEQQAVIKKELKFIDQWLENWAPEDVKFSLREQVDADEFSNGERHFLRSLADKITAAPEGADGEWFHKAIYEFKDQLNLPPKELFSILYKVLIGKQSGPRAGWFLSILPRDWLISRLRLQK